MQAIFAYQTANIADYKICREEAQNKFLPDLNSMEEQNKEALSLDRKTTAEVYNQIHLSGLQSVSDEIKPEIVKVAHEALKKYSRSVSENKKQFKQRLLDGVNSIYDDYIKLLVLVNQMEKIIDTVKRKKGINQNNLSDNRILKIFANCAPLENERARKNLNWDTDMLKAWIKEYIQNAPFYVEYDERRKPTLEDDADIIQAIYKNVIFKNESINEYFEGLDIGWFENKAILKSMVLKTFKSVETEEDQPELMSLSKNWEEDIDFLKELYDLTLENESELEEMIQQKSKNWDIERVSMTDKIILEMAIAEMTNFPSIPIKVTINEYIELSKQYSTPKSKQFVNGLLDVLSVDLQKDGQIKKSGRGLLDNK